MSSSLIRPFSIRILPIRRYTSQKPPTNAPAAGTKSGGDAQINANVPGLSEYVIKQKAEPLGPGASSSGQYKVPEYFCYDRFSYHGAEVELAKYRCPQPSTQKGSY